MKTIYLDYAAGAPLRDEVYDAMLPYLRDTYGNPSSIHEKGREAGHALTRARHAIAEVLGVLPHEIVFTGSGSEGNNLALSGVVHAFLAQSETTAPFPRPHVLVSAIEHVSVLNTARMLEAHGCEVEHIPVDAWGTVSIPDIKARLRDETVLVSVMYANNEIGTIEPIREISDMLVRAKGNKRPLFHTDACQAAGQLPLSPTHLGVDLMTLGGSKIGGPRGVGTLYVHDGVRLAPLIYGGHQESGRRAGTENLAAIVGFARALSLAHEEQPSMSERLSLLRDEFTREVVRALPDTIVNGERAARLPNNIHFTFPYIEGESLVLLLDTHGICASTGSACNAHDLMPSHVLRAIGQSSELIHGSLRLTLGSMTTESELREARASLISSVRRLRSLSSLTTTHL